ncbi:MAG: acyl-CoA/acyl-ACP dehydrogenase, partial [Rhodospirillaceae bacterium]|nr:acyl-CoA/acyl-ACP dehydrogenase [Rhodospirillaceae bacterium]
MSSIAFEIPEEIRGLCDGLENFIKAEVIARHDKHHDLLSNGRNTYDENGRYVEEVIELIREVRMASSKAGYYNMCVPEDLGGSGLGMLAYYVAWEHAYRTAGPHNWLAMYAISHWALGPSRLLERVTEEARTEMLEGMIAGRTSMCFGMSEPGAGSDAAAMTTRATP